MTSSPSTHTRPEATDPRLLSLEGFLAQDPRNPHLRADAFELALALGELARAEQHVQAALADGLDPATWTFREASLRLAQKRPREAAQILLALRDGAGDHPAITHNLAYAAFMQGDYAACVDTLRPCMDGAAPLDAPLLAAMQALWLRALHRQGHLAQAWRWVEEQQGRHGLSPAAAGVASLIAVDAGHLPAAGALAQTALAQDGQHMEALVARATVAVAAREAPLAHALLAKALAHNPQDGRALSALGFTELLAPNLPQARAAFEQAVQHMPAHIGTWIGLGWTRLLLQDMPGARRAFYEALALDRNFGESHGSLAVVQALCGERQAAEQSMARAQGLDKGNLSARYAQAILSGEASDAQAIQRLAHRLLGGRTAPLGGDMAAWLPAQGGTPEKPQG